MITICSSDRTIALGIKVLFALTLLGSASTFAQLAADPDTDEAPVESAEAATAIALINGETLYVEDVEAVLGQIHQGSSVQSRSTFDLDEMLFRLVNDTLLAQEALSLGMGEDPALRRRLDAKRQGMARQRIEREEVFERLRFTEEELEAVFRDIFRTATLRILTRRDESEAKEIREEIENGADFEALVFEKSQDPYRMRQGLLTSLPAIDMPGNLSEVVFTMKPGDLGGPAPTGYGWTIFKVEALSPADPEQYEMRKGQVKNYLRFNKEEALRSELLAELRIKYPVEINQAIYDAITVKTMPDGRLLPDFENPDAIVATAGSRPITAAKYGKALASRWADIANPDIVLAIKPIMLDRLLVDEMLVSEAKNRGYEESPEVDRAVHSLETQLLVKQYLREIVQPRVQVDQEDLLSYYEANRDRYRRPPKLHVSQLTVASEAEAERLAKMIREGADFAWLARQHSIDRHRDSGGAIGWVLANEGVPGFTGELLNAKAGDLFGPVDFNGDWRLFQVNLLETQERYQFEEVSGNIRQQVEELEFLEVVDSLISQLRERSEIWINDEALAAMQIRAAPDEDSSPSAPGHG